MKYVREKLTPADCLMIQSAIVKYWNETEKDNVSVSGPISDNSRLYETPLGEITKGSDWIVDKINNSWLVLVDSGMLEITAFVLFFKGAIYPINSLYMSSFKLEKISYISNEEEISEVEKVAESCISKLGYMMEFYKGD
ncbi:hypothetical protein [Zooshikella ganghwensis]|uniref:Uncharacterized protein n=1 Tax=Zooshikella ganghwensis TaxID=202772 RepID=A0A4P9VHW0_9GAMM|nr:hypothetical protein [Zooshikella ganghwensis]RDH42019.1 hypothetical protein B9G39_00380 [Zooshikella ganghwensis]